MRIYDIQNMGSLVKMLRKNRGLTQSELAKQLNITRTCITNWETNAREVDIQYWEPLAKLFGISIEILCRVHKISDHAIHLDLTRLSEENRLNLIAYYCQLLKKQDQKSV